MNKDLGLKELGTIKRYWKNQNRGSFNVELYYKYLKTRK